MPETTMQQSTHTESSGEYALAPEQNPLAALQGVARFAFLTFEAPEDFDISLFEGLVQRHASRHDSLRMAYRRIAGYSLPRQFAGQVATVAVERVEGGLLPQALVDATTPGWDPERGKVLRVAAGRLPQGTWRIVLAAYRLAADEQSLMVLSDAVFMDYARERGVAALPDAAMAHATVVEEAQAFSCLQFAEWREAVLEGEDAAEGRAYWLAQDRQAQGSARSEAPPAEGDAWVPPSALLPPGFGATAAVARLPGERAVEHWTPSVAVARELQGAAAAADVPIQVYMQAVWWMLWARLRDFEPVQGGWQNDFRSDYDVMRDATGCFGHVMPLALALSADMTPPQACRAVRALTDAHRQMQDYACLREPSSVPPIVFTALGWPGDTDMAALRDALRIRRAPVMGMSPLAVLGAQAEIDAAGGLAGAAVVYRGGFVNAAAARVLLDQYVTLLLSAARAPSTPLRELNLLSEPARQKLLDWRGAAIDYGNQSLPARIAEWARQQPEAAAIAAKDGDLNYLQLHREAGALASRIVDAGRDPALPVALALPRGSALIVVMLAAWQAGRMYLPLDLAWPEARRNAILGDAAPDVVVCLPRDAAAMRSTVAAGTAIVAWEVGAEGAVAGATAAARAEALPVDRIVAGDSPAYLLYTSGSTGAPKGVVIEHGSVWNYVASVAEETGMADCRRFALTSSVAADLGNTSLFGALHAGGCLVIADEETTRDSRAFAAFLREAKVDFLKIVPSHLDALLEGYDGVLPRTVVLGGETATARLLRTIRRLSPGTQVYNHYGPTEATVGVLVHRLEDDIRDDEEAMPLTRPLSNCRILVLDEAGRPAAPGHLGQLAIGGRQLCRGYLHETHAEAFRDDPQQPGARLYLTGDRARHLPEGGIQLAGRIDDQVKVRGFRVEPAEIERTLSAHPAVRQCAVKAWQSEAGIRLAAYLVLDPEQGGGPDVACGARLRAWLLERLPEPMVPTHFVVLAALPRLANGKVDRQGLLQPDSARAQQEGSQPATALQRFLLRTTAELLERPALTLQEDLFDAGLHSLLVIRLVSRIRDALDIEILPGAVFEHPDLQSLAVAILHEAPDAEAVQLRAESRL